MRVYPLDVMKVLLVLLVMGILTVGCHQRAEPGRITGQKREKQECDALLDWFRSQPDVTVGSMKLNGTVIDYNIRWKITDKVPAQDIWNGNRRTIVPGSTAEIECRSTLLLLLSLAILEPCDRPAFS